ncbi:collagen-like protein, partial [bacterium]|nr:collagen-like protein [bacterium]
MPNIDIDTDSSDNTINVSISNSDAINSVDGSSSNKVDVELKPPASVSTTSKEVGPTGAQGSQGPAGNQGSAGSTGAQGATGDQGSAGSTGAQGATGDQGATGLTGAQGATGDQGSAGSTGAQGATGDQGSTGNQGSTGSVGAQGEIGNQGHQGIQGAQGSQGANGNFGGATFKYNFTASVVNTNPGSGNFSLNNLTQKNSNRIYINDLDLDGNDIQPYLRTIDDSTSSVKGHVKVSKLNDASAFLMFSISGSTQENTGYFNITVSPLDESDSSPFSAADDCILTFARTGDKGDTGNQGATGSQGSTGSTGDQGATGSTGAQGAT